MLVAPAAPLLPPSPPPPPPNLPLHLCRQAAYDGDASPATLRRVEWTNARTRALLLRDHHPTDAVVVSHVASVLAGYAQWYDDAA